MKRTWDVIIVGSGPAGLFSAYTIRQKTKAPSILVIDKGAPINERQCTGTCQCSTCHTLSGGGGAGLFSDGKLTLDPSVGFKLEYPQHSMLNDYVKFIESVFVDFGYDGIVYYPKNKKIFKEFTKKGLKVKLYPTRHIGSDEIRNTCKNFISFLEANDVKFEWNAKVTKICNDPLGVQTKNNILRCKSLVLALGRSGSLFLSHELEKLGITLFHDKYASIGVRIECGSARFEKYLKECYDLKVEFKNCRTFCFCAQGKVILENYGKFKAVNGHTSTYNRTRYTNFAVLVKTKDDILEIAERTNVEGLPLVQNLDDFIGATPSEKLKILPTLERCKVWNIRNILPYHLAEQLCEFIQKLDEIDPIIHEDTIVYAPEAKFLINPVKIDKRTFQTDVENLYVIGDCSGYTSSIVGASLSGIFCGNNIVETL